MTPLRKYNRATIWFRDNNETDGEYWDVCVYSGIVIFYDKRGHERTVPMVFIKEIIEYAEDRVAPKEMSQSKSEETKQSNKKTYHA